MINRAELKMRAKNQIKGNIGILFLCSLVIGLITGSTSFLGVGFLITPAFSLSTVMIYLALTRSIRPQIGDAFKGFNLFGKALWLSIITGFFTWAWSLLFVIPGIIKTYAYSMAPYILAENPNMTAREALRESKRITNGHKWDLFVLQLSFIGWIMLTPFTLGILFIWLSPYMAATQANFYHALKGNTQQAYTPAPPAYKPPAPSAYQNTPASAPAQHYLQPQVQSQTPPAAPKNDFEDVMTTPLYEKTKPQKRIAGFTGVSGMYADVSFPLKDNEEIVIGTDPAVASVVLDLSNPMISRRHMSIKYAAAENTYLVTDYSTNGTFANNIKLTRGIETAIRPGTLIKLVDDKTTFLLD